MPNEYNFAVTILSSAGVSLALCSSLGWLMRSWISERLKGSIKYEYDQKIANLNSQLKSEVDSQLANLNSQLKLQVDTQLASVNAQLKLQVDTQLALAKSEVDRKAEKLRIASSSFSEVQKAAIARKLDSVETLWSGILAMRKLQPAALLMLEVLTKDEISKIHGNVVYKRYLSEMDYEKIMDGSVEIMLSIEKLRPYIGEYTFALFSTYFAFSFRVIALIQLAKKNHEKLQWYNDTNIRGFITSALGKDVLHSFDQINFGGHGWIKEKFEKNILQAIEKVTTGKDFSEASLIQANLMENQIRESNREDAIAQAAKT